MKCSRRLYGGASTPLQGGSFALNEVVSATRFAMLSVATVVLFSVAGLTYIWNQTDDQIDRGNKIGFTVVFSSIIVATTIAIVFIAAPGLFALQRVNGYAYPSSIVYLLYAIAVALAVICVFIQAGNLIADNTNRNIVVGILAAISVASAGLALYYQTTFLPVDWVKLRSIVLKQDVSKYIDPEILSSAVGRAHLAFAVDKSSMDPNLKFIIIQRLKDFTTGTSVLQDFKYVDTIETLEQVAKLFKTTPPPPIVPNTGLPEFPVPVDPAIERARRLFGLRKKANQILVENAQQTTQENVDQVVRDLEATEAQNTAPQNTAPQATVAQVTQPKQPSQLFQNAKAVGRRLSQGASDIAAAALQATRDATAKLSTKTTPDEFSLDDKRVQTRLMQLDKAQV